jgi:hypothetical protein
MNLFTESRTHPDRAIQVLLTRMGAGLRHGNVTEPDLPGAGSRDKRSAA